jgi:hypothetical protein
MATEISTSTPPSIGSDPNALLGRNRNQFRDRRMNNQSNPFRNQLMKVEGHEPTLKGHIYDSVGERSPDQCISTTKEIVNDVGRTYNKFTSEFIDAVMRLKLIDPEPPSDPDPGNQLGFEIWKHDIKAHGMRMQEYSNFRSGLYNVILGQCTEALQDKLKSHTDFAAAYQDGIELLTLIKELAYSFEERRKLSDALCNRKEVFYNFKQEKNMSLQRYHALFCCSSGSNGASWDYNGRQESCAIHSNNQLEDGIYKEVAKNIEDISRI